MVIGGCADITAQRKAEEEIQHLAFHDSLTGLPNRILFKEELKQALARYLRDRKRFALHFLDFLPNPAVKSLILRSWRSEIGRIARVVPT